MAEVITIAVTYWRPVTEIYTLKVEDGFDLDNAVEAQGAAQAYEQLEVEGVQVMVPETGSKQDFEFQERKRQQLGEVSEDTPVPVREVGQPAPPSS